jgi:hypothetical protein
MFCPTGLCQKSDVMGLLCSQLARDLLRSHNHEATTTSTTSVTPLIMAPHVNVAGR